MIPTPRGGGRRGEREGQKDKGISWRTKKKTKRRKNTSHSLETQKQKSEKQTYTEKKKKKRGNYITQHVKFIYKKKQKREEAE